MVGVKKLQPPSAAAEGDERGLSEWSPGRSQSAAPTAASSDGAIAGATPCHPVSQRVSGARAKQAAAAHYLQRRREPVVPFPSLRPLPKSDMPADTQARFLNVYLRPCALGVADASLHVPRFRGAGPAHLLLASKCATTTAARKDSPCRQKPQRSLARLCESEHAARTIRNFLAAAECTPDVEDLEQDKKEKRSALRRSGHDLGGCGHGSPTQ